MTRLIPARRASIAFCFGLFFWLASPGRASPQGLPEKLAFYYGWPSVVNGANGDTALATAVYDDYDLVVFGNGIDSPSHGDHDRTQAIIAGLQPLGTRVYGYVDLCWRGGGTCSALPLEEIESASGRWAAMGVAGIFLDQAGYDFGVSRDRLNAAVDAIHALGLSAFVNVWNPDDVFDPAVHPELNPSGAATHLGPNDYYLHESFAVTLSTFQDPAFLIDRSDKGLRWKRLFGTKVATVNTIAQANPPFDPAQFEYVWWTTFLYGFDAMAWGETWIFSADTNSLPFHARPDPGDVGSSIPPLTVVHDGPLHRRSTTTGTIEVDTSTRTGRFLAEPPVMNPVSQSGALDTDLIWGRAALWPTRLTLTFKSNGAAMSAYRIFLDVDGDATTGFSYAGNSRLGSEYMVENGNLYRFTGATRIDWSWSFLGTVSASGVGTSWIRVVLPWDRIGGVASKLGLLVEHLSPAFEVHDRLIRFPDVWRVK